MYRLNGLERNSGRTRGGQKRGVGGRWVTPYHPCKRIPCKRYPLSSFRCPLSCAFSSAAVSGAASGAATVVNALDARPSSSSALSREPSCLAVLDIAIRL